MKLTHLQLNAVKPAEWKYTHLCITVIIVANRFLRFPPHLAMLLKYALKSRAQILKSGPGKFAEESLDGFVTQEFDLNLHRNLEF